MATTFVFVVSCAASDRQRVERVLEAAHERVSQLEKELSEFLPESPVYQLNHSSPEEVIRFPESAIELLQIAERLRRLTGGAFDCCAKSLRDPRPSLMRDQWLNIGSQSVQRSDSQVRVGFGAIGKGYALDQVRVLIEQEGITDYWLSAGGSSTVLNGFSSESVPWTFGWTWSVDEAGDPLGIPFTHDSGLPLAVGVSGTQEQARHLLDPRTGLPIQPVTSALVTHPSAAKADALSTALFVSGWNSFLETLSESRELESEVSPGAAVIGIDSRPRWNGVFQSLFGRAMACAAAFLVSLSAFADETGEAIDLSSLGGPAEDFFNPYLYERNPWWIALPLLAAAVVLIHLKKNRLHGSRRRKAIPTGGNPQ